MTSPAWESQGILTEEGTWADPQRMSQIFPMEETMGKGFQELKDILIRGNSLSFRLLWLIRVVFLKKYAYMICNAPN